MRLRANNSGIGARRRGPDDGTWAALALAVGLHAALLALTPLFPARTAAAPPIRDGARGDEFDIETEVAGAPAQAVPEKAAGRAPESAPESAAPAVKAKSNAVAKAEAIAPAPVPEHVKTEPRAASEGSAPEPALGAGRAPEASGGQPSGSAAPGDTFSPPEGPAPITGLGDRPAWAIPGVLGPPPAPSAAPTEAPAARPVDHDIAGQVLSGSLLKKDHAIGIELPAGGVVASTIASVVRSSAAPTDARATFEVRLGPDGKLLGIRVVSSSAGSSSTWDGIAKGAAAALAARGLSMNGDAASKGATVTVKIESKVVYPAGTKEKYDVQPVCANEIIEDLLEGMPTSVGGEGERGPAKDPAANRPDPGKANADPAADERRRAFCIPIGIRGKGDLSNLGAHMQTVVRSTFKVIVPGSKQLEDVKLVDQRAPWSPPDPNKVQKIRPKRPKKKKRP